MSSLPRVKASPALLPRTLVSLGALLAIGWAALGYASGAARAGPGFATELLALAVVGAVTRRYGIPLPGNGFSSYVLGVVAYALLDRGWAFATLVAPLAVLPGDLWLRRLPPRAAFGNAAHLAAGTALAGLLYARLGGAIGAEAAARWPLAGRPNRPFRVDVLPAAVPFSQAWALADPRPSSPLWALVGVGGDELTAFGVDLGSSTPGFVIAGPAKSGRSTALLSMAKSLTSSGATLVAFCPRPSPLASLAGSKGVLEVFQGRPTAGDVTAAIDGQDGPLVVVVDDAEAFARSEADDALKEILRSRSGGAGAQIALVVAGQVEEMKSEIRGVIVEARKSKAGLLLSPSSSFDGELVGIRLARNLTGRMPAGRGVLAVQGETTVVQVPVAD